LKKKKTFQNINNPNDLNRAHQIYENLKNTYGASNCHLLQINSKVNQTNDPLKANSVEFDPWLKYCKYNDFYSNNLTNSSSNLIENNISNQQDDYLDSFTPSEMVKDLPEKDFLINNPLNQIEHQQANEIIETTTKNLPIKRHGMCLALSDHDRIKTLISEFLQRGIVPYVERTIKILNEQIQSKKSILKSFGIPRRIFGGGVSSSSATV
jgi:hypothetical protein